MQNTQIKTTISFLQTLIIGKKVVKIKTSFLEIWYSYLNNSFFYYNYNTKLFINYMLLCSKNSGFNHCFFLIPPNLVALIPLTKLEHC